MERAEVIVLDTHVLLWMDSNDRKIGRRTRALIDRNWAVGNVAVAAIVFWEIGMIAARSRIRLPLPLAEWRQSLLAAGVLEFPLDGAVVIRALDLAGLPDDPADRFIVATALERHASLVTADEKLLAWRHGLERHDARD